MRTSSNRTFKRTVVGAVLAAGLVVAAGVALRSVHTERVSPAIASYVQGRTGVVYVASNHSFRATFPVTPIEMSQHITAYGHDITMQIASANQEEKYSVMIAAMDLPPGVVPSTGAAGVPKKLTTVSAGALSAGGKIVGMQRAMQDGHTAADIELTMTHGVRAKFRVVMVSDRRVVVVGVVSPYRDAPGFQRLIDSLHVQA
ncbi:MAG: hypothetical protein JWL83_2970 [Actinomycetia bacterium]|nr:hypothetical protein [Actinomycetes bacterium]